MTAIVALLSQFWQPIAGGVLAGLGILYAMFVKKGATADVADARKSEADAHVKYANLAQSTAKANADASKTTADAAKDRTDVENQIAASPTGTAAASLRDDWSQ